MRKWNDIKIKTKFYLGMLALVLAVASSLGLFFMTLVSLSENIEKLNVASDLRQELIQREVQHLQWVNNLSLYLTNENPGGLNIQKDPAKCGFGQFYYGESGKKAVVVFPEIADEMQGIEKPHRDLHATAQEIEDLLKAGKKEEARLLFSQKTLPALVEVQKYFAGINGQLSADITGQQKDFWASVSFSRMLVAVFGVFCLLIVFALVVVLTRSILKPIEHISAYSRSCLTGGGMTLNLGGRDELGMLGRNLSELMEHLNRELAFSKGVLGGITVPCSVFSPEDKTVFTNQLMMDLLEVDGKPEDHYGELSGGYIWGDASKETLSTRALRENKALSVQREFTTRKGNARHAMISSAPFYDQAGEILGTLSIWVNITEVVEKQKAIEENGKRIAEVAASSMDVANSVSSASQEISVQVEQSSQGANMQRDRVAETAAAMAQMNQAVIDVANSAASASNIAAEAKENATNGSVVVKEVMESIERVEHYAGFVSASMEDLSAKANGIGQIISVINDIADQTNLLALNAAIEAARAGEAGRGFAVVADEVRKLAEKTMLATKEVTDVISGIQEGTKTSSENVEKAAGAINEAKGKAEEAGHSLGFIVSQVEDTAGQVQSIATAAEEQSATSEHINSAIEAISSVSEETRTAMVEASQAVEHLARQADSLRQLINRLQSE